MAYDRRLLLHGAKRNAVLALDEVEAYGRDSYGNPEHVRIYGLRPAEWHARGVRLLGRTAVECTPDALGDRMGRDVARVARQHAGGAGPLLIDPFAGSGNTLYWLARHLRVERAVGFELDPGVFALTARNLATMSLPIEVLHADYRTSLERIVAAAGQLVVAFVAPPWGDAFDPAVGLDLRRTYPPVAEVAEHLLARFAGNPLLLAVQVHERTNADSLDALVARFAWSTAVICDVFEPGRNCGLLLATHGWRPAAPVCLL